MSDNIGGKIKTLSRVTCWIGIIASIIIGFILMAKNDEFILIGVLIMILGCLASWIGSFMPYGFGELIENSQTIIELLEQEIKNENTPNNIPMSEVLKPVQLTEHNVNYDDNVKDAIIKKMIEGKTNTSENEVKIKYQCPKCNNKFTFNVKNITDFNKTQKCLICGNPINLDM